ncbi:DUF4124 domain-containing protein [Comamonas thiooxydans]|uniref:DUF4124 domain-containing protein n=1 Tax=Comamonas thiooxydans TaxID=363952 RepID=UPI002115B773|nr:DUF4124 domain-containing protein [Comamonas thiooxydans]UUE96203.1 DUF4124 domain-containing protein [Comamonas thiooxydans]
MKTRQQTLAAVALLLATCSPAWAIYKCDDGTGKQVFQDRPCTSGKSSTVEVKPASGHAAKPSQAASTAPATGTTGTSTTQPMTEAERLNAQADHIRKRARLRDINDLYLNGAYLNVDRVQNKCRSDMEALSAKKRSSTNNLAGATWEQSISAEMQAVATRCQAEQQTAQNELERLRGEKSQLEQDLKQK